MVDRPTRCRADWTGLAIRLVDSDVLDLVTGIEKCPGASHRGICFRTYLLLGGPEDLGNRVDFAQEAIGHGNVVGLLSFPSALSGLPKEVVQRGVGFEVLGLEVVSPQNPEVVLHQFGTLFLDTGSADLEVGVAASRVLFHAGLN